MLLGQRSVLQYCHNICKEKTRKQNQNRTNDRNGIVFLMTEEERMNCVMNSIKTGLEFKNQSLKLVIEGSSVLMKR